MLHFIWKTKRIAALRGYGEVMHNFIKNKLEIFNDAELDL